MEKSRNLKVNVPIITVEIPALMVNLTLLSND